MGERDPRVLIAFAKRVTVSNIRTRFLLRCVRNSSKSLLRSGEFPLMNIDVSLSIRMVAWLLIIASNVATHLCNGADPKIIPVKLVDADISNQIVPEAQGGGKLMPLRKLNYERMRSMIWNGYGATILADGADPNAVSSDGEPILFYVLSFNKLDVLEAFLKAGADPNGKSRDGSNPLRSAIWRNNVDAVKLLLQYGADPNAVSMEKTAIQFARENQKEIVKILEANNLPTLKPTRFQPPEFLRHPDKVFGDTKFRLAIGGEALIYSNDSRQVISGGDDGAIRFFDAGSGEIQNVIAGHNGEVAELARIPGTEILISSGESETKFWDRQTSRELMRLKGGGRGLSVSTNGRWLFTGLHLWEIESAIPLRLATKGRGYPQETISWTFFTPDNRYLILGVQNGYAYVWNLENDQVRRIGNLKTQEMQSLKWGDMEGIVDVVASLRDDLLALATSPYTILTGDAEVLQAFEPALKDAGREARSLACSPDGRYMAAIGNASCIDIYDRSRGGQKLALEGHTRGLQAVAVSPDGQLIASGSNDRTVRLWDRKSGEQLKLIETASFVYSLCFSPEGKQLAIGDNDGGVYVYDFATRELKRWQDQGRITSLRFDAQGETLFALGPDLTVLDPRTGERLVSVFSNKAQQGNLVVTPSDLIIGSGDGVEAWTYKDKRLIDRSDRLPEALRARGPHRVAVASNGSTLAVAVIGIQLWDLDKREPIGGLMQGHTYFVEDMKFSPDGKLLATGGGGVRDGTTRIWEVPSGRLLVVLDADVNRVESVAFLPDGSLLTANWNGTVHLWNLPKYLGGLSSKPFIKN